MSERRTKNGKRPEQISNTEVDSHLALTTKRPSPVQELNYIITTTFIRYQIKNNVKIYLILKPN